MYKHFPWTQRPPNLNVSIWRYFALNRFADLLEHRQLHFARLDQFGDAYEGALSSITEPLPKDHFQNLPARPGDALTDFQLHLRNVNRGVKLCFYANCWFMSEHESDAMWKLYAPGGVAIRSTFLRLCESLEDEPEDIYVGMMRYFDFDTEQPPTYGNLLAVTFFKRIQFEHERELRAVMVKLPAGWTSGAPPYAELHDQHDKHPAFMKAAVNLDGLIDQVYVAPGQPDSFPRDVRSMMLQSGLDKPILASRLDARPDLF